MKNEFLKIGIIFFVTVAVVLWALNFIFFKGNAPRSKATGGETMTLTFDPPTVSTAAVGPTQLVTVTLKIKPSVNVVLRGYSLNFPFDKNKLDIKSIDYKVGVPAAGLGDTTADIAQINQAGRIKLIGEVTTATGATVPLANPTDLVVLKFTVPNNGATTVSINDQMASFFAVNSSAALFNIPLASTAKLKINGGGPTATPGGPTVTPCSPLPQSCLTIYPGTCPTPAPTGGWCPPGGADNVKLKLKLKFQGIISKPPTDALSSMTVKFRLYDENTEQYVDNDNSVFTSNEGGIWSGTVDFNNINTNHKFALLAKGPHHMQKKICNEVPTETAGGTYRCARGLMTLTEGNNNLDLSGIILLTGDLPVQNGAVDAYDISLVRNCIGKTDANCLSSADVNRDGKVNTQDYSLIIASLTIKNDEL